MTNLLINGKFADNLNNWLTGGIANPSIINNQSIAGQTLNAVTFPSTGTISQSITLNAGTTYYLQFYVKYDSDITPAQFYCSMTGWTVTSPINLVQGAFPFTDNYEYTGSRSSNYTVASLQFTISAGTHNLEFGAFTGADNDVFQLGDVYLGTEPAPTPTPEPPCFNKGTNILCLNSDNEEVYIPVEQLKSGDLVKTYNNGYKKIDTIAHTTLQNNADVFTQCMYIMPKQNDMTDDLIVTGGHSILVDNYESEQVKNHHKRLFGGLDLIDNKYLLLAGQTPLFKQITDDKVYDIYHLCLEGENENDDRRYGIWANGVLTESTYKSIIYNRIYNIQLNKNKTNVNNTRLAALLRFNKTLFF